MQCSEYQSGEKFKKKTRLKGGSIYDSLKGTSSECQSNGNIKQASVNGGRSHDSLKVASALNFQSDGNSNIVAPSEIWLRDDLENIYALLFRFLGFGFRLAMSNVGWPVTQSPSRRGRCCSTQESFVTSVNTLLSKTTWDCMWQSRHSEVNVYFLALCEQTDWLSTHRSHRA